MVALLIFAATLVVLAIGRFPGLRIDRAGAAIVGASLHLSGFSRLVAARVAGRARPEVQIRCMNHFRVGAPVTVLTPAAGAAWLGWLR